MAIFVDENSRVVVQGLTGKQGQFYGLRNRAYGTNVVAGTNPKKAGTDVEGIPIYATVKEAVEKAGANTSFIIVPASIAADSIMEAAEGGVKLIICVTEHIPAHDQARVYNTLKDQYPDVRLIGPNCAGILSPGKANIGFTPTEVAKPGGPVGIVSRSGTLAYQALYELTVQGIGQTTCVGIGGDPVPGTSFIDVLKAFQADPETKAIVLIGEIGGSAEEEAAEYIKANVTKPVVAYIAGVTAPPGKKMGHAGAIVSGGMLSPKRHQDMTAKNKNDSNRLSSVYIKRLVAFFLVSLSCPVWLVLLVVVVGFIDGRLFRYQKADVLETCAMLNLPAGSRFCSEPTSQNPESLQDVLDEVQSSLPTTLTELKALVQTEMRCFEDGPDQVCRLYLPVEHTSLWILYTTDDTIKRYEVYFSN